MHKYYWRDAGKVVGFSSSQYPAALPLQNLGVAFLLLISMKHLLIDTCWTA